MTMGRMDDDRHPCEPGCRSSQHAGLRCMGMDQYGLLVLKHSKQLPQGLYIPDRIDLSRQSRKQRPADCGLFKLPAILLSRCLPALSIPTPRIPGDHERLELRAVMAKDRQHRVLRRSSIVQARDHMDHLSHLGYLFGLAFRRTNTING